MTNPWNEYRDSLIVVILKVAVVFGASNHLYDPVKQQLVYSSRAFIYRILLRLVSFIVCVVNYNQLMSIIVGLVGERDFLSVLSSAYMYLHLAVIVSAVVSVCRSCGRGTRPFNELLGIRVVDSISSEELASIQRHTWKLFFLKSVSMVLIASTTVLILSNQCESNAPSRGLFASLLIIQIGHMTFMHQIGISMLYGGYLFKALNLRLAQVVKELNRSLYLSRRKSRRLRKELTRIGAWHTKLLKLMTAVKDIDEFHLFAMLTSGFLYQVCALFYLLLAARGLFGEVSLAALLYSTGFTLVASIDLLVGLHICGECVKACDASGGVLRGLTTFLVVGSSLERDIDVLCFQFARERLRLTLFGMFDLDANTGPNLFKGIMANLILLAQVAYDELH